MPDLRLILLHLLKVPPGATDGQVILVDASADEFVVGDLPTATTRSVPLLTVAPDGKIDVVCDENDEWVYTEVPA